MDRPVAEARRIESLDVLRGFALLGILLLNILGFGLLSASYSNAGTDLIGGSTLDRGVWAGVELLAEGAMRALFSMLFGAGVVLFTTGARGKSAWLHTKRTFWLLAFGLFDSYVLLWNGDILVTYALAGAALYWCRNWRARSLLVLASVLIVLMSLFYAGMRFGLGSGYQASVDIAASSDPESVSAEQRELAESWRDFAADFEPTEAAKAQELEARRESYVSAFRWNVKKANEMISFVIPVIMLWDSLAMMLIGMALFKAGVLQGGLSRSFYWTLMLIGFPIGLAINGYEVVRAVRSDFDLFSVFAQMQPTYHFGRLGMALGYIGLVMLWCGGGRLARLQRQLAAVGRMALTNYLMHSALAVVLFTGLGLGLVGHLSRASLYLIVLGIWVLQMVASEWWLKRFHYGPAEWLWRWLTYGQRPEFSKARPTAR